MNIKYKVEDYIGKKFGKWTILENAGKSKDGHKIVKCRCECGTESIQALSSLINGKTMQCRNCALKYLNEISSTHGLTGHPLQNVWNSMKQRCSNEKQPHYKYYGAKSIKVCDEWLNSFESFYNWAINNGYKKGLSIDRIDVNGDYCPENCRWTTNKIQSINRNKQLNNTSGYIGIHIKNMKNNRQMWEADIYSDYKTIYLGTYKTQKEALEIRNKYIIDNNLEYHIQEYKGEFGVLNTDPVIKVTNTSGYTGINWNKQRKKWSVRLIVNHERKYVGFYSDLKEAVEARNKYIIDNKLLDYPIQEWKGE